MRKNRPPRNSAMMPASFYHEKFQRKVPQCVLMHANCCDRLIVAQGSFAGYVVMLGHACASYSWIIVQLPAM